ncbi:MAG: retroviral-like aspartic protease family protein [Paludibacteraceae bacterium]|nr:retroviral-like aspartic protease family protein [Paludibacteraceae bacterium]
MGVFSKYFDCRTDAIVTNAEVFSPVDLYDTTDKPLRFNTFNALWDTGATQSLISSRVVKALKLKPIDEVVVSGIDGAENHSVYLVHLGIPEGYVVPELEVIGQDGIDYDVVIGMDIMSCCDIAFSNKDGVSVFSFRLPSKEHIVLRD